MPVIDGYRFAISLDDRGMTRQLSVLKAEANALKNVMRANFTELRNSEGTFAAYTQRSKDATASIHSYELAIERLKKQISAWNEQSKDADGKNEVLNGKIARGINTINRYKVAISNLQHQQEEDNRVAQKAATGIDSLRKSTEAVRTVTKSASEAFNESGHFYEADRVKIRGLRQEKQALSNQLKAEVSVTKQLSEHQSELQRKYISVGREIKANKTTLATLSTEIEHAKNTVHNLSQQFGENSTQVNKAKSHLDKLNSEFDKTAKDIDKAKGSLTGLNEQMGKSASTYANQVAQTQKVAKSYQEVSKAASGFKSTRLGSLTKSLSTVNQKFKESTSHTRQWASSLKSGLGAASLAVGGVTAAGAGAVKMAGEVQQSYKEVNNLLQTGADNAKEAARSTQYMNKMQSDGVKYSQQYGFSQKEIAQQYEELVRRGYDGKAAIGSMNAMMQASRASGDDLTDVVKSVSQAVDAFNLRGKTANQMMQNSERVANAMASGADRTASGFQDMGLAMSYVSSSANAVGWSVEQTSAAIGVLSNRGLEGSRAGTSLRKVINSLVKPTKNAQAALKDAGLSMNDFVDSSGKLKPVDEIFNMINKHTAGWSQTKKGAFFNKVFGATGQAAGQMLADSAKGLKANNTELGKLIGNIENDEKSGYIYRLAQKNMQSTQMQLQRLKMTAQAMAINIGQEMLPAVNKTAKYLADWSVSPEGKKSISEVSVAIGKTATTIANHIPDVIAFAGGIGDGFKSAYHFVQPVVKGISFVANGFKQSNKQSQGFARSLGKAVGVLGSVTLAVKVLKTLFGGFFAIGKDSVSIVKGVYSWITRGGSAQRGVNAQLEVTNRLLKEQIALQKQINNSGGNHHSNNKPGSSGGSAVDDIADAVDEVADLKGGKSNEVAKDVEKMGAKHARFWQRGWLGKFTGWSKKAFKKLDPTNLIQKFADLGDKSGKGFFKRLLSKLNPVNIFKKFKSKSILQRFADLGDKAGTKFTKSTSKSLLNHKGKIKFSALFKYGSNAAEKAGTSSGLGWVRRFAARIGDAHVASKSKWASFFGKGTVAASEAGTKGAGGFLGKFAGKLSKGAGILGAAWQVASAGIDIVKGIRSHNPEQKMSSFGKAGGMAIGTAIGAAIGGPGGALVGSQLGEMLGGQLPRFVKWGKTAVHQIGKGWNNGMRWFQQLFSGDMKGIQKGWNNFWGGMGNWFDKTFGVDTGNHKTSSSHTSKKTTVTSKIIHSGVKVTKTEIANVKKMSTALKGYATQLKRVHNEIKNDQVEKQLESVNNFLLKHTKSWGKASKQIKDIGDAFKYLATFANSMVKKDAFAAFNQDLPKLDNTLKKHASGIKSGMKKLNDAFKTKKGQTSLNSRLNTLSSKIDKLSGKFKKLNGNLNQTARDFRSIDSVLKKFSGKKNPFNDMASGLDKLKKALERDTKKIKTDISDLRKSFEGTKKTKSLASLIKGVSKPLDKMSSDFKSLSKTIKPVNSGLKGIQKSISSLASTKGKGSKGKTLIGTLTADFNKLTTTLKNDSKKLPGYIGKITSALGSSSNKKSKGKGLIGRLSNATSALKSFNSRMSAVKGISILMVAQLKAVNSPLSKLKSYLNSDSSAIKKLHSTIKNYPFGNQIAKQGEEAVDGLKGKGNFSKRLSTMTTSVIKDLKSFRSTYKSEWNGLWKNNTSSLTSWIHKTESNLKSFNSKTENSFKSLASGTEKIFSKMWDTMHQKAGKGMNSVLRILNDAIGKVDTVISRFGGNSDAVSKVSYVKYATGTGVFSNQRRPITKLTPAILNDGNDSPSTNNKEGILRNGNLYTVHGRNVPTLLAPGDEVLNASEMAWVMGQSGVEHFATGTGGLKALYEEAKKYWKNPTKTAHAITGNSAGNSSGAIHTIAKGMFDYGVKQTTDWWVQLWKMVEDKVDSSDLTGLAKAAAKYGDGKPYVWGAHGPNSFDCSGLVQYTLKKKYGIDLPAPSGTQYSMTQHISKANAKPGDLVFWGAGGSEHVGIYMGGNKYYSAQSPSQGIGVNTLSSVVGKGAPLFGRIRGLHIKNDEDASSNVKANTSLQKKIKTQVGKGFWKTIQKIADKYGEASGGTAGTPSGDHTHWMKQAGIPESWYSKLNWMIQGESGWNPSAVNPSSGTYGLGQMQSYNLHYYTAHGSKSNPIAQLMGIKDYILDRYGSIDNAYAFRKANNWYANGGISTNEKVAHISEGDKPEAIIPLDLHKRSRAQTLLADVLTIMSNDGSSNSSVKNNLDKTLAKIEKQQAETQKFEKELLKLFKELLDKPTTIETNVKLNNSIIAKQVDKYQRQRIMNSRNGISSNF